MLSRLALVMLLATSMRAFGGDAFGLGDGHDGALDVRVPNYVMNAPIAPLAADIASGATELPLSVVLGFRTGDLVLVVQSANFVNALTAGDQSPIDLTPSGLGQFALARIVALGANALTVSPPLPFSFPALGTQVVTVREFTAVTVADGASMVPAKWNGSAGGVLAFFVNGTVTVSGNGSINADAAGFRGGAGALDPMSGRSGCSGLNQPAPGGAMRGEGIAPASYGANFTGRGNVANAGGGGVCSGSGGGGGGHGGRGGPGGRSYSSSDGSRNVGGLGGTQVRWPPQSRLVFGGGGGAGHSDDYGMSSGGSGGGAVFIRAQRIEGSGRFSASGGDGRSTVAGAGGGGAGGTVALSVSGSVSCASIVSSGGNGGDNLLPGIAPFTDAQGTGGGGAGGVVEVSASSVVPTCAVSSMNGVGGTLLDGGFYGSGPVGLNDMVSVGRESFLDAGAAPVDAGMALPDAGVLVPRR
jgi:hypothetical protein